MMCWKADALVGRVHGQTLEVFSEAGFLCVGLVAHDQDRDGEVGRQFTGIDWRRTGRCCYVAVVGRRPARTGLTAVGDYRVIVRPWPRVVEEGSLRVGLQDNDIKAGLAAGGRIRNVFITAEVDGGAPLYRIYLRSNWSRHFLPLRTWADRSDRTYRDLDRAVAYVREECAFNDYIVLYSATDPRLARYRALAAARSNKRRTVPPKG